MHILEAMKEKKEQVKILCVLVLIISFLLFILCLIFFGSAYNNQTRVYRMNVFCVDLDGSIIGRSFLEVACINSFIFSSSHIITRHVSFPMRHRFPAIRHFKLPISPLSVR